MFRVVQKGGKLEINNAETAIGWAISHVPDLCILVPDTQGFEIIEKTFFLGHAQAFDPFAAVGGHQEHFIVVGLQDAGHEVALFGFEEFEDAFFVLVALARLPSPEGFEDPAVVGDMDVGEGGIFDFRHASRVSRSLKTGNREILQEVNEVNEVWDSGADTPFPFGAFVIIVAFL